MKNVIKRDGSAVVFDSSRIFGAINKAAEVTEEFDKNVAAELTNSVVIAIKEEAGSTISVESIQDIVEIELLNAKYYRTAKAYILYREQHSKLRDLISSADIVDDYLDKIDWEVKENSNMGYSIQGLNNYISAKICKSYWLNKIYPREIREAHKNGDMHIHDLNMLSVYCVGWDLMDLLLSGFTGVNYKTQSSPAKHFSSALGQIVNFLYTLQGEATGAQAFSNFDTLLAPFIRYDKLSYSDVKQAMQEFIFNLNVPTRTGFQTPFTNITMDVVVPSYYKNQNVIIGGKLQNSTYGEFQSEMNMLNKAFCEVVCEGDSSGKVFTFPIPTYNITKNFDWNNTELNSFWEMAAKYGVPYFSNFVNSDMNPEDARSMCCRLRIDNRELSYRGGGLFGANPLTGSIGIVTVNLPKIGFLSKSKSEFYENLYAVMSLARNSLEIKRKALESFTEKGLYPYTSFYLRNIKQQYGIYWQNHFSTIGLVGMNEACLNFLNKSITEKEGRDFALNVIDFMRNTIFDFKKETGNNYNLEATPAEATSYRLAKLDKSQFKNIKCANDCNTNNYTAEPFYTNSTHTPVNYSNDIFEVLTHQDEFQSKYTGGTVLHIYAGERIHDPEILKNLVKKICNNYKLPYFTFSPTFSSCPSHGYISGSHNDCPICNQKCEVFSRIVGYLRPISQWNDGKLSELALKTFFNL